MAVDWATLPFDLVATVAMKMETLEDFVCFSAVCRSWNRASSSIKHLWRAIPLLPWLLLAENTKENPNCVRKIFNLHNNKCYKLNIPETFGKRCWGSAYGWVAMVDRDFRVQLFNPLTKAHICFPSLETITELPTDRDKEKQIDWFLTCFLTKLIVLKVSQNGHDDLGIMVLTLRTLAFATHGDQTWTSLSSHTKSVPLNNYIMRRNAPIVDVVAVEDNVFALYNDGGILYWNVKEFRDLKSPPMVYSQGEPKIFEDFNTAFNKIYLVKSGSDLLMLLRFVEQVANSDHTNYDYDIYYRTLGFEVYRFDVMKKSWEEIFDFGDVALFVGGNSSMSTSVAQAKCLHQSCIYFTDDANLHWKRVTEFGGHDMGVYDAKLEEIWRFYEGDDRRSLFCPPIWFLPQA